MEKLKMHTPDLADENFKKLAAMFPNAVTETITGYDENGKAIIERAIDADVLRQEISATVVEGPQERYQFTWPDKKKSVVLANQPIAKTLRLDREKSVGRDGTAGSMSTIDFISNDYSNDIAKKQLACHKIPARFDFPKPVDLIKMLLATHYDKDALIVDFFSGSATTAEAVFKQNIEDGGNRKFILIQLPEETQDTTYKTICEIGEERIRRAGKKIKEENPLTTANLDIGFRVFKVDSTNMEDVYYRPADYNQGQMELFADNIKADRTPEDLLFQVMLDLGILLSSDIEETEIGGKKVFSVTGDYLIACFDKDVTEETVKAIAQKQPVYAVFRDSSMASDSVATNFEQIFETYSPRTQRKVL